MLFKIANNFDEWSQAFRLLKKQFEEAGLINPSAMDYYFPGYFALPPTTVFVAKVDHKVVATTVTIFDNLYLGIPAEYIYPEEVKQLRLIGKVAEGGSIATDSSLSLRESLESIKGIMRLSFLYFDSQGYDQGIITAHPRHNKYYTKVWGAVLLGKEKQYPERNNKLVQGYWWTKGFMKNNAPKMYTEVFETEVGADLTPVVIPTEQVRHFLTTRCN